MKPLRYTLIALAATCGFAYAQTTAYTTPVGYVTHTLPPAQFTLVGLTLHNSTIAAGVIDAESADPKSVTDNEVNFSTLLTANTAYALELSDGTVQEITSWSGSVLYTPDDITGLVVPGTTTYKLRKVSTVAEVFGANNSAGLSVDTDGERVGTDYVLVQKATGGFDSIYYFDDGSNDPEIVGWYGVESGEREDGRAIVYPDAIYVQRAAGATLSLVVTGEVKKEPTGGVLTPGYNYLSAVAPAGLTLGTSGLSAYLTPDTDGERVGTDYVLIQQPNGSYFQYYYFNDGSNDPEVVGWYGVESGEKEDSQSMDGGFLIFNNGLVKPYKVSVPSFYATL